MWFSSPGGGEMTITEERLRAHTLVLKAPLSGHLVTVATSEGVEVLMHIGLDTVELKGQGFTTRVKTGDQVKSGDALIDFDADYVATHAKSLLTQVVITNGDRVASYVPRSGNVTAGKDDILELRLAESAVEAAAQPSRKVTSAAILIPNPTGLHARPAAVLANLAKKF